jgi:hypothetical protein
MGIDKQFPLGGVPAGDDFASEQKADKSPVERVAKRFSIVLSLDFDHNTQGEERVALFIQQINLFLDNLDPEKAERVKDELRSCAMIDNKVEFIERAMAAVQPVLNLEVIVKTESQARELIREEGQKDGSISLSEILSCSPDSRGDRLHLHWAPSWTISPEQRMRLLLEGMQKLAQIVKTDEKIKRVEATSWVVTKMPDLLKGSGFIIDGPISEVDKKDNFPLEEGEVGTAHIDREELLARYLNS